MVTIAHVLFRVIPSNQSIQRNRSAKIRQADDSGQITKVNDIRRRTAGIPSSSGLLHLQNGGVHNGDGQGRRQREMAGFGFQGVFH